MGVVVNNEPYGISEKIPRCPACDHPFKHVRGMKYCPEPCEQSAVDYNSGSEVDRKYRRLIGAIALEL